MTMCSQRRRFLLGGMIRLYDEAELKFISFKSEIRQFQSVTPNAITGQAVIPPGKYLEDTPFGPRGRSSKSSIFGRFHRWLSLQVIYGKMNSVPWFHSPRHTDQSVVFKLGREDTVRWRLAAQALKIYGLDPESLTDTYVDPNSSLQTSSFVVHPDLQNWALQLHLPLAVLTAI